MAEEEAKATEVHQEEEAPEEVVTTPTEAEEEAPKEGREDQPSAATATGWLLTGTSKKLTIITILSHAEEQCLRKSRSTT